MYFYLTVEESFLQLFSIIIIPKCLGRWVFSTAYEIFSSLLICVWNIFRRILWLLRYASKRDHGSSMKKPCCCLVFYLYVQISKDVCICTCGMLGGHYNSHLFIFLWVNFVIQLYKEPFHRTPSFSHYLDFVEELFAFLVCPRFRSMITCDYLYFLR